MANTSSLKSLSDKALNAQLKAAKALEKQLLTELDNRLFDRQQKLKAKVKGLTGLDRTAALFKPITAKRAMETIRSVRSLLAADMAKVPNLKFYHLLSLDSTEGSAATSTPRSPRSSPGTPAATSTSTRSSTATASSSSSAASRPDTAFRLAQVGPLELPVG